MINTPDISQIMPHVPLIKHGKGYCHEKHDSLKFYSYSGKWFYKWFSCDESGDLLDYLRRHENKSYYEAKTLLNSNQAYSNQSHSNQATKQVEQSSNNWKSDDWQKKANRLIYHAQSRMLKEQSSPLQYLKDRGLKLSTIVKARLGFLPDSNLKGAVYPAKHVIPVYNSNKKLIRVRFRYYKNDKIRYGCMKGSEGARPYPIGITPDTPGQTIVICESELDGLLIHQETGYKAGVLAMGQAKGPTKPLTQWLNRQADKVIIALDNDIAGKKASDQWLNSLPGSTVLQYPGKDPGYKPDLIGGIVLDAMTYSQAFEL
ncbi:DNA primase [Candidatus Magnetomorum sp. HK-1]|nr:DNA primase [Candidatus Magnetomorum sp. HK-1]